jgi:hypothetical protein
MARLHAAAEEVLREEAARLRAMLVNALPTSLPT